MLNAMHCSDRIVGNFVSKLRAQPGFERTLLVIGSDHKVMKNSADIFLDSFIQRNLSLFIIDDHNSHQGSVISNPGTSFDIGATILSYLTGVRFVELGLGRSLIPPSKSLLSKHKNLDSFAKQLDGWRPSFLQFWRFPDSLTGGFSVNDQGIVNVEGSFFALPVAFELGSGAKIENIILIDFFQSEFQRSNKTVLLIYKCPLIQSGLYCFILIKDIKERVSGLITLNKLIFLQDLEESVKEAIPETEQQIRS